MPTLSLYEYDFHAEVAASFSQIIGKKEESVVWLFVSSLRLNDYRHYEPLYPKDTQLFEVVT